MRIMILTTTLRQQSVYSLQFSYSYSLWLWLTFSFSLFIQYGNAGAFLLLAAFLAFLQRRKVYVLIEKQAYNKAQRMLKKMLNDPENADFALNELAYLQKKMKGED